MIMKDEKVGIHPVDAGGIPLLCKMARGRLLPYYIKGEMLWDYYYVRYCWDF